MAWFDATARSSTGTVSITTIFAVSTGIRSLAVSSSPCFLRCGAPTRPSGRTKHSRDETLRRAPLEICSAAVARRGGRGGPRRVCCARGRDGRSPGRSGPAAVSVFLRALCVTVSCVRMADANVKSRLRPMFTVRVPTASEAAAKPQKKRLLSRTQNHTRAYVAWAVSPSKSLAPPPSLAFPGKSTLTGPTR